MIFSLVNKVELTVTDQPPPRSQRAVLISPTDQPKVASSPLRLRPAYPVKLASRSRKGYWQMSQNSLVRLALNDAYLKEQGVPSLRDLWIVFEYTDKAQL